MFSKVKWFVLVCLLIALLIPSASVMAAGPPTSVSSDSGEISNQVSPTRVSPGYCETSDKVLPPLGALSDQEIKKLGEEINGGGSLDWIPFGWEYQATITSTWTGYTWRGWKVSGGPGGTVSLSQTFGISNGWNATIGFKADVLTATVGYNVTYSSSWTASYSHNVSSGMYGFIGYADFYSNTVHDLNVSATYYVAGIPVEHQYGTAQTWAWTMFAYDYGETTSPGILPPTPYW